MFTADRDFESTAERKKRETEEEEEREEEGRSKSNVEYSREEQHLLDGASPNVPAVRARGTLKSDGVFFLQNLPHFQNLSTSYCRFFEKKTLSSHSYEVNTDVAVMHAFSWNNSIYQI